MAAGSSPSRISPAPTACVVLTGPDLELTVLPDLGARLHRLRAFGHDILHTPRDPAHHGRDPFFWGAYHMAPWCNRLVAGQQQVGRRRIDLAANFRDGSAIHGQVYVRPWQQTGEGQFTVVAGGDGWPWPYEVNVTMEIGATSARNAASLVIEQRLRNLADEPMPAGLGLHPWFSRPVEVAIHAASVYQRNTDEHASLEAVAGDFDLRLLGPMASGLDATWTNLDQPPVQVRWPAFSLAATISSTSPSLHVTAASPTDIDGLAVEPESHTSFGLDRLIEGEPGGMRWLEPGETLGQRIDIQIEQVGGT